MSWLRIIATVAVLATLWPAVAFAQDKTAAPAAQVEDDPDLDLRLSRDAAPFLIIGYWSEPTFVSNRVGCLDLRPYPDLAALCLK